MEMLNSQNVLEGRHKKSRIVKVCKRLIILLFIYLILKSSCMIFQKFLCHWGVIKLQKPYLGVTEKLLLDAIFF